MEPLPTEATRAKQVQKQERPVRMFFSFHFRIASLDYVPNGVAL